MYVRGLQAENEMNWNHNRPTNMKQQAADTFFFSLMEAREGHLRQSQHRRRAGLSSG